MCETESRSLDRRDTPCIPTMYTGGYKEGKVIDGFLEFSLLCISAHDLGNIGIGNVGN